MAEKKRKAKKRTVTFYVVPHILRDGRLLECDATYSYRDAQKIRATLFDLAVGGKGGVGPITRVEVPL